MGVEGGSVSRRVCKRKTWNDVGARGADRTRKARALDGWRGGRSREKREWSAQRTRFVAHRSAGGVAVGARAYARFGHGDHSRRREECAGREEFPLHQVLRCFARHFDPSFLACRSTRGCRRTVSQTSRSARPVRTAPWRRGRRRCAPRRGSFGTCSRGLSPSCTPRPSRSPSPRRWNPRSPTPRPRPRHPTMLPSRSHPRTRSPSPRRALGRLPRRTTRSACRLRSSTRTRSAWPRSTPRYARVPARTSDGTIGQTERSKKGCPFFFCQNAANQPRSSSSPHAPPAP